MRERIGRRGAEILTDPVPTKFYRNDLDWVDLISVRSGLGRAEVIRRSVRVLAAAVAANPEWNWVKETAKELPPMSAADRAELDPGPKGFKLPGIEKRVEIPAPADGGNSFADTNRRAKAEADAARRRDPRRTRS